MLHLASALLIAVHAATTFLGVPADCERLLLNLGVPLADVVDWRPFARHARRINAVSKELKLDADFLEWDGDRARRMARAALGDPDWDFSRGLQPGDSERLGAHEKFRPIALPVWSTVPGFDARAAVRAYATSHPKSWLEEKRAQLDPVAPYWIAGPGALDMALFLWERVGEKTWSSFVAVTLDGLRRGDRAKFLARVLDDIARRRGRAKVCDDQNVFLRTLAHTPAARPITDFRGRRRAHWIDTVRFPPVRARGLRQIQYQELIAGTCPKMADGHLTALLEPKVEHPTFVYLNGVLVGFVKCCEFGDPSLLALRHVTDARGRALMALGGVYRVSIDLPIEDARPVPLGFRLDVKRLGVRPLAFLLNDEAWQDDNPGLIWRTAFPHLSRKQRRRLRDHLIEVDHHGVHLDADHLSEIWFAVLEALVAFRERLESGAG